jgi:hypothetical protein
MEIKGANIYTYLIPDFLSWRKKFFRLKKGSWMVSRGEA